MRSIVTLTLLVVICLWLAACTGVAATQPVTPTATPRLTSTPRPTLFYLPTIIPSATATVPPTVTSLPTATQIPTATPRPDSGPVAALPFEDALDSEGERYLPQKAAGSEQSRYGVDGYVIELATPQASHMVAYSLNLPDDLSATIDVSFSGEAHGTQAGLVFRYQNPDNYYAFLVNTQGEYQLYRVLDGEQTPLIHRVTGPPRLSGGDFLLRQLGIGLNGPLIELYANHSLLASIEDDALMGGSIGLAGTSALEADRMAFTNLQVTEYGPLPVTHPVTVEQQGDLRTLTYDTYPINSDQFVVPVEAGDVSFQFFAQIEDATRYIAITEVIAPDGEVLYQYDAWSHNLTSAVFTLPNVEQGDVALFMPVTPAYDIQPGEYTITVETSAGDAIRNAGVVFRSGNVDGIQAIDLNIWLVNDVTSFASANFRAEYTSTITRLMNGLMTPHNLRVGRVSLIEAPFEQVAEFAVLREARMGELCAAMGSVTGAGRAMNLALVNQITNDEDDPTIAGAATGTPGVALLSGSRNSCVVLAWDLHQSYTHQAATYIHEFSHFMSLPHTTDEQGLIFDRFGDTAECSAGVYDVNGDGVVDVAECGLDGGANNYMFWQGGDLFLEPYVMSAEQAWVLRRHPYFYSP